MFKKLKTFNADIITNCGIKTASGDFNKDYFLYAQILDKPTTNEQKTDELNSQKDVTSFRQTGEKKPSPEAIFKNILSTQHLLWSPRAMHGAEYNNGGFQSYVAHFAHQGKLVASNIEAYVTTRQLPSLDAMLDHVIKGVALNNQWKIDYGIDLAWSKHVPVYIIAPQKHMAVAQDMIKHFAGQHIEPSTHRGLGFNKAAIYQTLSAQDQDKIKTAEDYTPPQAWFDIQNGIFFTLDKEMFEKAKIAFDTTDYEPSRMKRLKKTLGLKVN